MARRLLYAMFISILLTIDANGQRSLLQTAGRCKGLQQMDSTGKCTCPLQDRNGAYYPECSPPLVQDPFSCDCVTSTTAVTPPRNGAPSRPSTGSRPDSKRVGGEVVGAEAAMLIVPRETVLCTGFSCACSGTKACTLQCTMPDACKDAFLLCPRNHDCTVICGNTACDKV